MEVVLHYRPCQDPTELQKTAEEALKEFPPRQLPRFVPWFPDDLHRFPLKPKKEPPIISGEEVEQVKQLPSASKPIVGSPYFDCTVDLLEFQPNLKTQKHLIQAQTECGKAVLGNLGKQSANEGQKLRRCWSVSVSSSNLKEKVLPLSRELQSNLQKLKLHAFYRARWTIEESVCSNQILEDVWIKLNRMIKHKELPSCNATIQRCESQIWVYCDILYCEYVGNSLRKKLNLTGKIHLIVHKYGVIYSL
uniref:Shieldin complex subunit 3 n=1 Tax=Sphenodon punctatus TaxID=8508 RepID=A0A8D0HB10_SPHPU